MREALQHFLEWHAAHFEDFTHEVNAELLCLANDAEAALADCSSPQLSYEEKDSQ
jgi:hypothetical protein